MKIKISEKLAADGKIVNCDKIDAALLDVAGTATQHTYTSAADVLRVAADATRYLSARLPKKSWVGAKYQRTSGDGVPNAYKYSRVATKITLEYFSSGWFLVGVERDTIYADGCGHGILFLTKKQDDDAVVIFRSKYSLIKSAKIGDE